MANTEPFVEEEPVYRTFSSGSRTERPRAMSALSHDSKRSRRTSISNQLELVETEKDKKRLHTKADPTQAMNELQPSAVALQESNLEDLRLARHKDSEGNVIADPDRSNPTRHRLERPLDTIRAFNAAAEGTTSRRSSYHRPASQYGFNNGDNRRSSYYGSSVGGPGSPYSPPRPRGGPDGGYYRSRSYGAFRPDSFIEEGPQPPQHFAPRGPPPMGFNGYNNHNGQLPSPAHSHQHSYETMTSGSDENNSKSTNPSSLNSSFDQLQQHRKPEDQNYGMYADTPYSPVSAQAYGAGQQYPPYGNGNYSPVQAPGAGMRGQSPPKTLPAMVAPNNPRVPIKLNSSSSAPPPTEADLKQAAAQQVKKKGWLSRKFSKKE